MALTIAIQDAEDPKVFTRVYVVTFDSSYDSGGESFTPANAGMNFFAFVQVAPATGLTFGYDYTTQKIVAFVPGVTTGAAGALVLDDFPMTGVGATAASIGLTAGNTVTRFGLMKEVAAAVDLSSISTRVLVIGR